jgi:excisionase family DNA binding protein
VSRRTVSDWARAGKLDAIITPGGHRRFRATQVRALLESQMVAVTVGSAR